MTSAGNLSYKILCVLAVVICGPLVVLYFSTSPRIKQDSGPIYYTNCENPQNSNRSDVVSPTNDTGDDATGSKNIARNIAVVFTGRWQFLRILIPYLYRDLRSNGGVIDEVWFMRIKCDKGTLRNLTKFIKAANSRLNQTIFSLHGQADVEKKVYISPYKEMLPLISSDPVKIKFFKLDDDIVYIHPGAFKAVLKEEDSKCLLHFFNIAGSNWKCSWLHQNLGVYKDTNPKHLIFGYDKFAKCGWSSPECAELTLNTFLHHYHKGSLDRYFFHSALEYIGDKTRFSINAMLLDWQSMDLVALMQASALEQDDERWFTEEYATKSERTNCIVGKALVVHFSYSRTRSHLLEKTNLLSQFEEIVKTDKRKFKVHPELWQVLGHTAI